MKQYFTYILNKRQTQQLNTFQLSCSSIDHCNYSIFSNEASDLWDIYILIYHENQLIGVLSCFVGNALEVSGLIHPLHRRQGLFTSAFFLLQSKFSKAQMEKLVFSGKEFYPGLQLCAFSLGYLHSFKELSMEYPLSHPLLPVDLLSFEIEKKQDSIWTFYFFKNDYEIGQCSIYMEPVLINIFDVSIYPEFRGKKLGTPMLISLLNHLQIYQKQIILQVSTKNKPAYQLYIRCGFIIIDSIIYYSRLL